MTQSFLDMIHIFSCGALGTCPRINHRLDIAEIRKQAIAQGVWPTVFLAMKKLYENGQIDIEASTFNTLKYNTVVLVAENKKRLSSVHDLLQKFKNSGVKVCVLKGECLALLYQNPDFRISGDTDILIDPEDKNKAIKILKEFGFDVRPLNANSHHVVAIHPVAGMVELHLHLHDELFEDVWFDNKMLNQEPFRTISTLDGKSIQTLGITDGLVFTALHYIKHFLSCGVGIRQLMDVLLYMKSFQKQIDWERFNELMKHLKFQRFMEYSVGIGVQYLNLDKFKLPEYAYEENIINKILNDIENGGTFGKNQEERNNFYMLYTKVRYHRFKSGDYHAYMKRWWWPNYIDVIFPHPKNLRLKYAYLRKTPLLYPIAWFHRIIDLCSKIEKKEKAMTRYFNPGEDYEDNIIVQERMDLIRKLDMI